MASKQPKSSDRWRESLGRFVGEIQRTNREFDILREIDRAVLDEGTDLILTLKIIGERLTNHFGTAGQIVFISGGEFHRIPLGGRRVDDPDLANVRVLSDKVLARWPKRQHAMILKSGMHLLALRFSDSEAIRGYILLQDDITPLSTPSNLVRADNLHFANDVARQLKILFNRHQERRAARMKDNLASTFFNVGLNESECWRGVIDEVQNFLPQWVPFNSVNGVRLQLLLSPPEENSEQNTLNIVASEGNELENCREIPVEISNSVCGLALGRFPAEKYALFDLATDKEARSLYKGFLLNGDSASSLKGSELVVPLLHQGGGDRQRIVGVLNFEHPNAPTEAFSMVHINAAIEAAALVAPFVHGLSQRHNTQATIEGNLLRTVRATVERAATLYDHKLSGPVLTARMSLDAILRSIKKDNTPDKEDVDSFDRAMDQLLKFNRSFVFNLQTAFDDLSLRINDEIIKPAIILAVTDMENPSFIKTRIEGEAQDYQVRGTRLMIEHFFNFITNACQSMDQAVKDGLISRDQRDMSIVISKSQITDNYGVALDKSIIKVEMSDNGIGCSNEIRSGLGRRNITSKENGHGIGLVSAFQYFNSIGGSVEFPDPISGRGFSVVVSIPGI